MRFGDDGRPMVCFAEVLACLVKDTYTADAAEDDDEEAEGEEQDGGEAADGKADAAPLSRSARAKLQAPTRASFQWADVLPPANSAAGAHYWQLLESKGAVPGSPTTGKSNSDGLAQAIAATQLALALKRGVLKRIEERAAAAASAQDSARSDDAKNGAWGSEEAARLRRELEQLRAENARLREEMRAAHQAQNTRGGARELI